MVTERASVIIVSEGLSSQQKSRWQNEDQWDSMVMMMMKMKGEEID
jgi:hypothetical protein